MYADEFSIYAGNANKPLAERITRYLKTQLGDVEVFQFANENIFVRVMENVREQDVFLVQPTSRPVNQSIMELLIMIDAFKRASAGRITAVIPHYSYGRSDKKDQPRVPITARLIADMLTVAGADRVLTMDLHQGQIQGFFSIPVDELTAVNLLCAHIKAKELDDIVVVSELGFAKKARNFAELLQAPLAIVEKRRLGNEDLQVAGAQSIYACATHGVFSGSALERIAESPITEVIVTDTIPLPPEADDPRITVLSVAPLFGEAIKRIHRGESVGALFSSEVQMVEEMTFWDEEAEDDEPIPAPFRVSAGC